MKKSYISIVALATVFALPAFAQDTYEESSVLEIKSSKGENYLPEKGDCAIGFDALPLINTIGKVVSANAGATSVTGTGGATNYITAKYFFNPKFACRAILGVNWGTQTDNLFVPDAYSATNPPGQVTDSRKITNNSFTLGVGVEKRRGNTRLQGYYGGLLMFKLGGTATEYYYGNPLSVTNIAHTSSFGQAAGLRLDKTGNSFGMMINALAGAEYFVLPKISIGAEYWWGVGFSSTGNGQAKIESWNGTEVKSATTKTAGNNSFGLGGQYASASVFVNLHF